MRLLIGMSLVVVCGCQQGDFYYADGSSGRYQEWHGSWVAVNYWAEWCAPCRYEIPELNELAASAGDDESSAAAGGAGEVRVIGVNYDGIVGDELNELVQRMGIEFPVVLADPQPHFGYDRPSVLPTTVLIDPQGMVRHVLVGPQTRDSLEGRMTPAVM